MKDRSRELRKNATFTERLLWKYLRAGQLKGYRFLRQKLIDEFLVDFYCKRLQLVIEIDGVTHNDKQSYDKRRENRLKKLGFLCSFTTQPGINFQKFNMYELKRRSVYSNEKIYNFAMNIIK